MGGACSTYGWAERCIQGFWWGNQSDRDHLEDPGMDGRINNKMDLREVGGGVMDWIDLVQDRDRWRAFVNAVMNFRVPQNVWNRLASQDGLCSMEWVSE